MNEYFDQIEALTFAARVGVASDFRTFVAACLDENAVLALRRAMADVGLRIKVVHRALRLARQANDPRYESRWDSALAVYLLLLKDGGEDSLTRLVADSLATTPQLWWARKLAVDTLSQSTIASSTPQRRIHIDPIAVSNTTSDGGQLVLAAPVTMVDTPFVFAGNLGASANTGASPRTNVQESGLAVDTIAA
jgi:hypothetical protein